MKIPSWDLSQIITSYNAVAVIKNARNLYLSGKIRFQSARGKTGLLCISFGQQLNTDTQLNWTQYNSTQLNTDTDNQEIALWSQPSIIDGDLLLEQARIDQMIGRSWLKLS